MIDRERWSEALRANLSKNLDAENPSLDAETAGFHIPQRGSLVLHEEETARGDASLMRLVSEEAARDTEELLLQAQRLDEYARDLSREGERGGERSMPLSLYASATPNGRLVANFCACSPFDETDEALAMLDRFLQDNPLSGEAAR